MKDRLVGYFIVGSIVFGWVGLSQAGIMVYHDQASFLAAAGSVDIHDFESDAPGAISSRDFGDFSIDATGDGIYLARVQEVDENNEVYMCSYNNLASLDVVFENDISAFGFDYIAAGNQSWDHSTFSLLGTTWDLGIPGDSGFFGVIETSGTFLAGTEFSFGQNSINWSGVRFDNVIYSANGTSPVPEPASVFLFASGLAGLAGLGRKKKQ